MTKKNVLIYLPIIGIVFFFLLNSLNYIKLENMNIVIFLNFIFYVLSLGTALYFNQSKSFLMLSFIFLTQIVFLRGDYFSLNTQLFKEIILLLNIINSALILLSTEKGIFSKNARISYIVFFLEYTLISFYLYLMQNQILSLTNKLVFKELIVMDILFYIAIIVAVSLIIVHGIIRRDSAGYVYILAVAVLYSLRYKAYDLNYSYIAFTTILITIFITVIKKSYQMAYYDELTGIPGRRALNESLLTLGKKYSIAMLDIDHFKKFNDTYGHKTGDDVLRLVASIIKDIKKGKAYRYGGEEFAIIFKNRNSEDVIDYLEELRQEIATRAFYFRSKERENKSEKDRGTLEKEVKKLFVTISMGVANRCEEFQDVEEVIKAGDDALYEAKKSGRNCVCHY